MSESPFIVWKSRPLICGVLRVAIIHFVSRSRIVQVNFTQLFTLSPILQSLSNLCQIQRTAKSQMQRSSSSFKSLQVPALTHSLHRFCRRPVPNLINFFCHSPHHAAFPTRQSKSLHGRLQPQICSPPITLPIPPLQLAHRSSRRPRSHPPQRRLLPPT
jgi:hypothetical protein